MHERPCALPSLSEATAWYVGCEVQREAAVASHSSTSSVAQGGWLHSFHSDKGFLFESGGRGLRPSGSGVTGLRIIEDLGLQHAVLPSSPAASSRFVCLGGSLHRVPTSFVQALTSPVSSPVILSAWRDLIQRPCPDDDETIDTFVARHLGSHAASLANAVVGGIFAGDSRALSVRSVFPALWNLQQQHGSLALAALRTRGRDDGRHGGGNSSPTTVSDIQALFSQSLGPSPSSFLLECARATSVSFTLGTTALTRALEEALLGERDSAVPLPEPDLRPDWLSYAPCPPRRRTSRSTRGCEVSLRVSATVRSLQPLDGGGVAVLVSDAVETGSALTIPETVERIDADFVVSALPASALAAVLRESRQAFDDAASHSSPSLVARAALEPTILTLDAIPTASVAAVNLGYAPDLGDVKSSALRGFGYLIPASERKWADSPAVAQGDRGKPHAVLGMTFDSDVFPRQSQGRAADPTGLAGSGSDTRLTVMIGGSTWPEVNACAPAELERLALQAARAHVGITKAPTEVVVNLARCAIPQYTLGHHSRVAAVTAGAEALFGGRMRVIGNSFRGVGIADSLSNAVEAAEQVLAAV